jgi:hypothetical protein
MDWLERDLQGSFVVGSFPAAVRYFYSSGKADRAAEELDPPLLDVTTASALGTSLLVAATGLPANAPDQPDQAHVIYRLESEEDADELEPGLALVRYDFRPALGDDLEEASRAVVARRVRSVTLHFFDGATWFESWDSKAAGIQHDRAPLLVEIRVSVLPTEGAPLEFVSAVMLPLGGSNAG